MRVFKDKHTLESMKQLRRKGYTYKSLAFIYGVDFSSIYHHCKGVKPKGHLVFQISDFIPSVNISDIISLLNIKQRGQKTYAEYLQEYEMRKRFPTTYNLC